MGLRMTIKPQHKGHSFTSIGVALALCLLATRGVAADASAEPGSGAPTDVPPPSKGAADISKALGDLAVQANPAVGATRDRIQALEEQVSQAGAWMDPTFSAEYSNMPINAPVPGKHPMSGIQLTLRQTFPWPGKIDAREVEARSRVRQEQLTLAEQKLELRAAVRHAYYRLALTRQLRAVTQRHAQLASDFLDVVRVKNEAGVAAQHELLRLRVLVDQLQDDLESFDEDEQALTAVINATLHRRANVPVPTPEQTVVKAPVADAGALAGRAARGRPLLQRSVVEAETYRAAARRAERDGYPDITLWAGYRVRTEAGTDMGTDFFSLGVSLPIPLFYDQRSGSEQRRNEKLAESAVLTRAADLDSIRGNLGRVVAAWTRAAQQARTYRQELTPEARLALEATFSSYQVSRADFAALFQAELQLLNFERTTLMAEARAADAQVDAEALVGGGVE